MSERISQPERVASEGPRPERILLVRLSHLGDVVHALGVFHALHAAYPRAEIGWAIQPEFAGLLDGLPGLGPSFHFGRREGWRAWPRLRRELRDFAPDWCIDAQGNLKSAAVAWSSGAPRRIGLARTDQREPLGSLALTETAPPAMASGRAGPHAMDRMAALAKHVAPDTDSLRLDPALADEERAAGERELTARIGAAEGGLLLHLSSPGDVRSWPAEAWERLAAARAEDERPTLVLSGPAEEELGRTLAERLGEAGGLRHWVGQRGLRALAAVFDAAARRGMRMVACDSGPMHLAAACGLPVVVLEGPQHADRTGPWPLGDAGPHRVLRTSDEPDCAPCFSRRCGHADGPVCMSRIGVDDVLALSD